MKKVEANSFVTSYLEAWNERDASSVTEHLCPNGRYIDEVSQLQIGREALFDELVDYFQSDHYFYEVTGDILTNGKTIAFQYCAKPMAPDNWTAIWHGAEFITLRGGSALEIRDYYQTRVSLPRSQRSGDAAGMKIELELAWVDLVEVVVWLFILFFIELRIRLQDRGISSGRLLSFATTTKGLLYGILWCLAAYWAYRGHWIFAWDEALWILGFMAIGMNLSDWRKEIAQSTTLNEATSSN